MLRIAHTADIHIRALSRHDEYRQILSAFVKDCLAQCVDHIFVGGDIFHTKTTGISPEYIDLLTWWLTEMAKIAEVHLILGNHDGNLVNLTRQDAVSPIVEALANPRIHLYKKSGVYSFAKNHNFCVFSVFDEEGWNNVRPENGFNIAAYHGPVWGSKTETGWDIEDGMTVDFFSDYDLCFLGDIHKPQFLGYKNSKPWIAYPGTPIQQNYAEQIDHSYLVWTINDDKSWSVETRPLPNIKPFVTIDWSGSHKETLESAKKFPLGSRFRIRSQGPIKQDDVHRLSESLKTSHSASEITFKTDKIEQQLLQEEARDKRKLDLRSSETLVSLIKDHNPGVISDDSELKDLDQRVKRYLSSISQVEETSRSSKWSLRQLKWDNLFSYGEGNSINFDKYDGIVGIFGPNRTGKSSIVGSVMYALFNTTDRGPMKNINICNVRKNFCSSSAIIDHNGLTYAIERQTVKSTNKKGIVSALTSLNLFRVRENEEVDDLCGEQRNDTEKTIRSLIGNSEDFLMTALSAQGDTNNFISQGPSKRRAVLARFLDLDIFEKMYETASKDVNSSKSQLKNFPDRDWEAFLSGLSRSLSECDASIGDIDSELEDAKVSLSLLQRELSGLNVSLVTDQEVSSQEKKVENLSSKKREIDLKIESLAQEKKAFQDKLEAIETLLLKNDMDDLKRRQEAHRKLEMSIASLRHAHEIDRSLLDQQKRSLVILNEVPCGDSYPSCKFIKDAHAVKKIHDAQRTKTESSSKSLSEAEASLSHIKDGNLEEKISKLERAQQLRDKLFLEISKSETEIERSSSSLATISCQLSEAEKKLSTMKESLSLGENAEAIAVKRKISDLREASKNLDSQKMMLAQKKGKLLSETSRAAEEKAARESILRELRINEIIATSFSKKGIPLSVTKSQLPVINAEVSSILHGIVDFSIELESDEDTDSLEIYINYGDSRRVIELCSGMEKTIASIALRVALVNVSTLPRPNFFIIDEGFGTLDAAGVESCNRLLSSLKRYFKSIFVITHVDGIKDAADHVIEISKNEKDSRVEAE